jgi:hypothetical protein
MQRHDFAAEPLLLPLEAPLSTDTKAAARSAFERARASPGGGPAVYIATDVEPEGGDAAADRQAAANDDDGGGGGAAAEATGDGGGGGGGGGAGSLRASSWATAERPTPLLVRRARGLAAAAARVLLAALSPPAGGGDAAAEAAAEAATADEADAAVAAAMLPAFLPALQEFDALLELEPRRLPRRAMQLDAGGGKAAAPPKAKAFANLQHGQIASGVGDDAVAALVARLEARPPPRPKADPPQPHPPTPASTPASASAPHPHPPARAGAPRRRRALFLRRVGRRADRDQVAAALLPARAVAPRRCAGPTPPHARRAARRAGRQEGLQDLRGDELAAAQRARAARGHVRDERRPRAPRPPRAGRAGVASVAWVGSLPPRARGSAPRTGQCGRARTRSGGGRTFFLFFAFMLLTPPESWRNVEAVLHRRRG